MKMRFTLMAAAAAMLLTAQAETLTIPMGHGEGATIVQYGRFNANGMFIGNTNENTVICVGTVDLTNFKAVSVRFANGWGNGGKLVLKAGDTYADATPFAEFNLIKWHDSYQNFRSIGTNFTGLTGEKKVYMTFAEGRAGNVMDIRFYEEAFTDASFESGSMLKEPNQMDGYNGINLPISGATLVYSPNADTRVDGDSWGWTTEGVVVDYGLADFGEGGFDQVVLGLASHWNGDVKEDNVDVFVDDYTVAANKLATVWTGIEVRNGKIYVARDFDKELTGEHRIYLVWHGGSTNIADVEFSKGHLWSIGNRFDATANFNNSTKVNETPSEKAVRYSFRAETQGSQDAEYVGSNSGRTTLLNKGQWENDNVGFTEDGAVYKISGIDFKNGEFDKMLISHSTGNNDVWMYWYPVNSTFKLYIDLEPTTADGAPRRVQVTDWSNARAQLADTEPVATVWKQPSDGWGNVYTTKADLSEVKGVHDLYVVFTGDGANIKDFYLDDQEENPTTAVENVTAAKAANGNVYSIDGRLVKKNATSLEGLDGGIYIFNGQKYIVK